MHFAKDCDLSKTCILQGDIYLCDIPSLSHVTNTDSQLHEKHLLDMAKWFQVVRHSIEMWVGCLDFYYWRVQPFLKPYFFGTNVLQRYSSLSTIAFWCYLPYSQVMHVLSQLTPIQTNLQLSIRIFSFMWQIASFLRMKKV